MEEIDVIYNRYGTPMLRLLEDGRLVSFTGKSIGFIKESNLFNYSGEYCGWFENGIMRDQNGHCVGFGENASDFPAPFFPFKQFKPFPGFVEFEPFRPFTGFIPFKPLKTFSWSEKDPISLFFK
ncbi:MAG: hypothetical protein A2563_02795 [Candidatus Magasanikbacteria bacterium RIFOXYD1_FULL_40_23]|uniref:4-fold beta flower domain-containing protein n=1 Tax=Candidatus Magasanikbacteria bacterium RIFOXYD1_FULL_40_23 TaxID=1798705 RepID=A0A1F6P8T5_9BACT|nr:MAG: hypothetical protein A2563_02795 [Candidatus Magasanikbacteria bacterium RIFOXYD1_FULL_40_23]